MPNAKVLSEKQAIVEALAGKINDAKAGVLVNYSGISVADDTALRRELREAGVEYSVVKNTLLRFALDKTGLQELDGLLAGTTSLAISREDPILPAKIIKKYVDKLNGHFELKGGFMDGKVISLDEVNELASIPELPVLQAQVLGTMLAPITSFAVVIKAIAEKLGGPVEEPAAAE